MGRKRIELTPGLEAEIRARTARGESADAIWRALGGAASRSWVARKQAELRGRVVPLATAPPARSREIVEPSAGLLIESIEAVDGADVPDQPPEDAPAEQLNAWIARLEKAADAAEREGKIPALASIASKVTALMALRHKSAPLPRLDPNENPDMRALAAQGRARLEKLARDVHQAPR